VLVGAEPANKSDCTPLFCFCQLFPSVERKIVPESSSAQYTERSGDGTSTARAVPAETVCALAPAVGCADGVTVAVGILDAEIDSPTTADLPADSPTAPGLPVGVCGVGACERLAAKAGLASEDVLTGAWRSALPPETCELRIGTGAVATGCRSSLVLLAPEVGMFEGSTVGASAAAIDFSAAGDDTTSAAGDDAPAAAAVAALAGVDVNALGVTAVVALAAAEGVSDAAAIVGPETIAVDSDAAVDSGATTVALG
jgi:hypothetical protein